MISSANSLFRSALAAIVLSGVFLVIAFAPHSFIKTPAVMDAYFGGASPAGSWSWHGSWTDHKPPFAFRVVYKGVVDLVAAQVKLAFPAHDSLRQYWTAFVLISWASFLFAAFSLLTLLREFGFERRDSYLGVLLWLLLPPIALAYHYPVQTKEDFLAYGFFFWALTGVLRCDFRLVLAATIVGALIRETLLLIPVIWLFVDERPLRRFIPLVVAAAEFVGLRLFIKTSEGHDLLFGFRETLREPALSVVSVFFFFGFGWIVFWLFRREIMSALRFSKLPTPRPEAVFWMLLPIAFSLLFLAHVIFGRISEIRISSLLAPWIVVGTLALLRGRSMRSLAKALVVPAGLAALLLAIELSGFGRSVRNTVNPSIGQFADAVWWMSFQLQILTMAFLVCLAKSSKPSLYSSDVA